MFNRTLLMNRIATIFVITQSANQTITVTCDGVAHTSTFVAYTGQSWSAVVGANEGYNAGTLNASSGVVRGSESVWATEATPSIWTATMVVGYYHYYPEESGDIEYWGYNSKNESEIRIFGSLSPNIYDGHTISRLYASSSYKYYTAVLELNDQQRRSYNNFYVTFGDLSELTFPFNSSSGRWRKSQNESFSLDTYLRNNQGRAITVKIRND